MAAVVCCARGVLAVDLLIVGAGPTGLYAAYYAGFRGLTSAVVDALPEPGGQITAMYQEKMIFDVAGFPAIPAGISSRTWSPRPPGSTPHTCSASAPAPCSGTVTTPSP